MVDLTNLPTDSLYKFLALAGVVLFLASYTIPSLLLAKTQEAADQLLVEVAPLNVEAALIREELERAERLETPSSEQVERIRQRSYELRKLSSAIDARKEILIRKSRMLRGLAVATLVGGIFSMVVMWTGFGLWYFKLQRYQDMLLKSQAEAVVTSATE